MVIQEALIRKALAFTKNTTEAERIAAEAEGKENPSRFVSEEAVRSLRQKNPGMFSEELPYVKDAPEFTTKDPEAETAGLTDEERIVVLLASYDQMDPAQTAEFLGISEENVRAHLQSAWNRKHQKKHLPAVTKKPLTSAPKKEQKSGKKLPLKIQLGLTALLAVVLGVFFGIRSYASGQYQNGLSLMEKGDYHAAVPAFRNAVRYGCTAKDLNLKLAESYYMDHQSEEALTWFEKYYGSSLEINPMQMECYESLWEEALEAEDLARAADLMHREYVYTRNPYTLFREKAAENGGTFTDEKGNVWNLRGMPEKLTAYDNSGTAIYSADLVYNSKAELTEAAGMKITRKAEGSDYLIEVHPGSASYTVTEYDSHGMPLRKTVTENEKTKTTEYVNTYDNGQLKEVTFTEGNTKYRDTYIYKDDRLDRIQHNDTVTSFDYDSAGNVVMEVTKKGMTETEIVRYSYDENGRLLSRSVFSTGTEETFENTPDGEPYLSEIRDESGKVIAAGCYIRSAGWIYLRNE